MSNKDNKIIIILTATLVILAIPLTYIGVEEYIKRKNVEGKASFPTSVDSAKQEKKTIITIIDTAKVKIEKKVKNIEIKGEGFGEDMFYETEARKKALENAMNNLCSKFPKEKENAVKRYAIIVKDTVVPTSRGTREAHIILSVNESDIK